MTAKTKSQWSLSPRFRVTRRGEIALGPGKIDLLAAILEAGSLSKAAKQLDMSYMRAWLLVRTMNACFCEPLVYAQRGGKDGGGAQVTAMGRRVLELYNEMETAACKAASRPWRDLQKFLRT